MQGRLTRGRPGEGAYTLNPATPVLLRPDGTVQVGWDPRRAVTVSAPAGMSTVALAELLRALQSASTLPELQALAHRCGATDTAAVAALVTALVDHGLVTATAQQPRRSASIRIHGRGPLSDVLSAALRCSGARISHSSRTHAGVSPQTVDLVLLADSLVADPRLVRDLHSCRVPHLPVCVRDGVGLIGPLVIPTVTSCLGCADLHRSDRDAAWPALAAQLRDTIGTADRATVLATAALALKQVDRVIDAVRGGKPPPPPVTLDTTLEFDVNTGSIAARRWSRHPRCAQCRC